MRVCVCERALILGQPFLGTSLWEPDSTAVWNGDVNGPTDSHSGLECGRETSLAICFI